MPHENGFTCSKNCNVCEYIRKDDKHRIEKDVCRLEISKFKESRNGCGMLWDRICPISEPRLKKMAVAHHKDAYDHVATNLIAFIEDYMGIPLKWYQRKIISMIQEELNKGRR